MHMMQISFLQFVDATCCKANHNPFILRVGQFAHHIGLQVMHLQQILIAHAREYFQFTVGQSLLLLFHQTVSPILSRMSRPVPVMHRFRHIDPKSSNATLNSD